ncbi:hypothetical protein Q5762_28760 [Streptomyces sp. P9(2023)]|uniref:hypothetical protein n=1 Tax=Streptomyces sp. P9(2023) TaxID=3064394 RepID=UPI0028F42CF0|nr:hypothetical protein [Streptomyces sp. P9(2023)]MDT9692250.1 hypothetical protein [Streptomyces sp. P9(2023)]
MNQNLSEAPVIIPSVLAAAVTAVREDSPTVVATVKANVQRAQDDENSCMMGGWTS